MVATSLEEQISVGGEVLEERRPEDETLAGLPPGGMTTSRYHAFPKKKKTFAKVSQRIKTTGARSQESEEDLDGRLIGALARQATSLSAETASQREAGLRSQRHSPDAADRARILAVSERESGHWLHALPSTNLGTMLDPVHLRLAVCLSLGARVCVPHRCQCGKEVDHLGCHVPVLKLLRALLQDHMHTRLRHMLRKGEGKQRCQERSPRKMPPQGQPPPSWVLEESDAATDDKDVAVHVPPSAEKRKLNIVWRNVILFVLLHTGAVYGGYLFFTKAMWATRLFIKKRCLDSYSCSLQEGTY
ncbi:hypothetical protein MSG28_006260 [Choristoneura fumiferana]|uniref:Uncharacterized protein n=1 Tax=Choristoneura fumiferana TaxID=7141 RepID=A0ACC0JE70_CHOFU|nr:hypothetical protein MSG28_006260 [Choristoneura fumiferana]